MSTLTFDHVTKRFGKVVAVNDFSLTVEDGEFLVLLGPSGCGKTTAMRMVAGLEEVTLGSIFIDDEDVTFLPPRKRNVSMIFQNYAVWPHMTVYENIAYPLRLKKVSKDDIDRIVNEVAGLVKIEVLLQRYPSQLSGGQQQRVAVARALAVEPKIFLMDEPLSNLDAKLRGSMRTELKTIHAKTGATSVFVTHDQSEAMSMADRIVVMKDGEVIQVGTPDDVYDRSASIFVADFIGTPPTNFLNVEKRTANGVCKLINPYFELDLKVGCDEHVRAFDKRELILGVRPENINVVTEDEALLSSECLVSEPQGSHQIVAIELEDKLIKVVAPAQPKIYPGEVVHLNFNQETLRFFDPESEMSIDLLTGHAQT
jgi:multiple sugar transport system ATP-binding protein